MIDFYFLPNSVLLFLFVVTAIGFALQGAHSLIIAFNNFERRMFEFFSELLLMACMFVFALSPIIAMVNRHLSVIDVTGFSTALYIVCVPTLICFFILTKLKGVVYLLPFFAVAFSLPIVESTGLYIVLYSVTQLLLFPRALKAVLHEQHRKRSEVSLFTIKQGMDTLSAGVLFSGIDGHFYLINACMLNFMQRFFNTEYKNATKFWEDLVQKKALNTESHLLDEAVVLRSKDDTWCIMKRMFTVHNTAYVEFIATDISETDRTLLALEFDTKKLLKQNADIHIFTENMIELRRDQEYSRIRSQIHDVMGQRLTAIQRMLQSQTPTDCAQIIPLLQNIVENIRAEKAESAGELLLELQLYFERIGIKMEIVGELPKNETIAYMFLSVLREATTNAARHASSTKVYATIHESDDAFSFTIRNNGKNPKKKGKEGGGISGMRSRVEANGGKLVIEWLPKFNISIEVLKKNMVK